MTNQIVKPACFAITAYLPDGPQTMRNETKRQQADERDQLTADQRDEAHADAETENRADRHRQHRLS
ncbi:hypothetical protein MYK68_20535 [Gordonia sp. PP30]|uniref:hypothetical protein n=1 Tax=unclassified Gordonia (in: high G+C Gram-positive bacteria) TaxID=2657482 RepID=UPI001FFE3909|nr:MULTISPECIES: hypothetical protein [unclassified Gordonia (in: high G+C Gram-positive bacteria)]UQE75043.1 hypothetical protein MYK68_20535 [Gordonia sp. PP30]